MIVCVVNSAVLTSNAREMCFFPSVKMFFFDPGLEGTIAIAQQFVFYSYIEKTNFEKIGFWIAKAGVQALFETSLFWLLSLEFIEFRVFCQCGGIWMISEFLEIFEIREFLRVRVLDELNDFEFNKFHWNQEF